jgi:hypothetical protein
VNLWERLDERQRQTLLAHELAHLKRRDHWVRLLEFITTVVFWWHPAVWVARRQIHDCEEQCCDAWVLWAMPASAHSYGSALLEAVDYVSTYRPMRPALAAGLGEFRHLKRRLLMIKQGTVSRALSRTGLASICAAAALALPLAPGFAQDAPPSSSTAGAAPVAPGGQSARSEQPEVAEARAKVAQAQADLQRARAELAQAMSGLAILEHGTSFSNSSGGIGSSGEAGGTSAANKSVPSGLPSSAASSAEAAPSALPHTDLTMQLNGRRSVQLDGGMSISSAPAAAGTIRAGGMAGNSFVAGGGGFAGSRSIAPGGGFAGESISADGKSITFSTPRTDSERRLQGLEQQMKELMDQLHELKDMQRQQQNTHTPSSPASGTPGEVQPR